MNNPRISIIAALSENKVIGRDGKLPWHIPEDLKRFRSLTRGHAVVMGRKTFESIGKLLPDRMNIIITRDMKYTVPGGVVCHSLEEALEVAKKGEIEEVFVIGGGEIFRAAIPFADKLYLTVVHARIEGDAFFPDYLEFTHEIIREEKETEDVQFTFLELTREVPTG